MKMRKLFAGVAAVATLLGGMSLSATAWADGEADGNESNQDGTSTACTVKLSPATISLTGKTDAMLGSATTDENVGPVYRTYKYVKLASLQTVDNDKVTVTTETGMLESIKTAMNTAGFNYDAATDGDPIAWLGQNATSDTGGENVSSADGSVRKFADTLATSLANVDKSDMPSMTATTGDGKTTLTYTFTDPGVYMIFDATPGDAGDDNGTVTVNGVRYNRSLPMLLSTKITGADSCVPEHGTGEVNIKSNEDTQPTELKDYTFTKVNKDGKGIDGAQFQVFAGESTTALKFVKGENGVYTLASNQSAETSETIVDKIITPTNGAVTLKNLDPNVTYTIKEIQVAEGYLDYKASFTIKYGNNKWTVSTTATSDPWNLVDETNRNVLNVQTIPDLPMTGAAGTILFTVVGALLAAAAATVFAKSRYTKRQLTA